MNKRKGTKDELLTESYCKERLSNNAISYFSNLNSFCSHHKDPQNQCSYLSWFKNCGKCDSLKIKK